MGDEFLREKPWKKGTSPGNEVVFSSLTFSKVYCIALIVGTQTKDKRGFTLLLEESIMGS